MSKIFSIYKATNIINGKHYIGQTTRWPARQKDHFRDSFRPKTLFHKAIRKYGWKSFQWTLIYQTYDKTYLDNVETSLIKEWNSLVPNGYNLFEGGHNPKWSLYSKHKASLTKKRYIRNHPEYLNHLSIIGKAKTPKGLKIISETTIRSHTNPSLKRLQANQNHSQKMSGKNNPAASTWIVIDPTGKKQTIKSIKTFCQNKGFSKGPAYTSQRRKLPVPKGKAKGWQFMRKQL